MVAMNIINFEKCQIEPIKRAWLTKSGCGTPLVSRNQ